MASSTLPNPVPGAPVAPAADDKNLLTVIESDAGSCCGGSGCCGSAG